MDLSGDTDKCCPVAGALYLTFDHGPSLHLLENILERLESTLLDDLCNREDGRKSDGARR